ncbi:MAG: glycoside hydrolase family 9 protein [Akkermansiaceae bacterium]|nr:glycoside hydrolase family 9 protein [Akkermansiaceae bacterium]
MTTNRFVIAISLLALTCASCPALRAAPFDIIINHLGYDARGSKRVVVQSAQEIELARFQILDREEQIAFDGALQKVGTVPGWKGRFFHEGDFSTLVEPGEYRVQVDHVRSERFALGERLLPEACLSDLIYYFRIQRCSGVYDKADRSLPFFGEPERPRLDAHGGWYDASGDVSKYLSHLSEANYMNPQQSPMAVWCFLESIDRLQTQKSGRLKKLIPLLREEALYGADFLVRMQDPSGYFYTSVMDGCSGDPAQREICGYKGLGHQKHNETQAGFREGGGMAIAALARISGLKQNGDYPTAQYLAAAEKGFNHLLDHNKEYADDHQENIIDDYCALLAATELHLVTQQDAYLHAARDRADSLSKRLSKDAHYTGWWRADDDGTRPFFHAVDAGLPVVALMRYLQQESDPERKAAAAKTVTTSLQFELAITKEVNNPFGYARQYVKDVGGGKRGAFFFPHRNETGYWWTGENARLASLATAARLGSQVVPPGTAAELRTYAGNQVNWILGLNPYDMCMLQGKGRNNPGDYHVGSPSPSGGICNGITSGVEDEQDIAFLPPPYGRRGDWSWRWSEQWTPHAAWLTLALAAEATAADPTTLPSGRTLSH